MIISYKSSFFSACCLGLLINVFINSAIAAEITLISRGLDGSSGKGGDGSVVSDVSADGRFVVYKSNFNNLVVGDVNNKWDVFLYDRSTQKTALISIKSNGNSGSPLISADGRFVGYVSAASNLVAGDTNHVDDVFVFDRRTRQTERVNIRSNGVQATKYTSIGDISADGRYVTFESASPNLVANDTNKSSDVFVHDRSTKQTTIVSIDSKGVIGNGSSSLSSISSDGRFVAFTSDATNLTLDAVNFRENIYVHDRQTKQTSRVDPPATPWGSLSPKISSDGRYVTFINGPFRNFAGGFDQIYLNDRTTNQTTLISQLITGEAGNNHSSSPDISADGRFVVYVTEATNLVPGDSLVDPNGIEPALLVYDRVTKKNIVLPPSRVPNQLADLFPSTTINADGRFIGFDSGNDRLVAGDTNSHADVFILDRILSKTQKADLQVSVSKRPGSLTVNALGNYNYSIINTGSDPVSEVNVTHLLSNGEAIALTPSQGSCKRYAAISLCQLGSLLPGNSVNLSAVVKALASPITQSVSVSGRPVDLAPLNNLVTVTTPVIP